MSIFQSEFWRSILWALVRTALAGVLPFVPQIINDPLAGSLAAVAVVVPLLIATVATSLKGTVDPSNATWGQILIARFLRQFGQFIAGALVGSVILWTFDWRTMLLQALASAISSVILAALSLLPSDAAPAQPVAQVTQYFPPAKGDEPGDGEA